MAASLFASIEFSLDQEQTLVQRHKACQIQRMLTGSLVDYFGPVGPTSAPEQNRH